MSGMGLLFTKAGLVICIVPPGVVVDDVSGSDVVRVGVPQALKTMKPATSLRPGLCAMNPHLDPLTKGYRPGDDDRSCDFVGLAVGWCFLGLRPMETAGESNDSGRLAPPSGLDTHG